MVDKNYIPKPGDIVWLNLDPTLGHEQKGRRPVLVISSREFNSLTNLAFICPITSTEKKYAYRISINGQKISGFVMVDQLRSVAWKDRAVEFIEKTDMENLKNITNLIEAVIDHTL
jgi:mRNA interferase MazF